MLHLDATGAGKEPLLMSSLDSIAGIVMGNVKLPSENASNVILFLEQIKQIFGEPRASVHGMSEGILLAVASVFPNIPDFLCHYHFLRDIGKNFLGSEYETIRTRLRNHAITSKRQAHVRTLKHVIDEHPSLIDDVHCSVESQTTSDSSIERIPTIIAYCLILWILDGKNQGHCPSSSSRKDSAAFIRSLKNSKIRNYGASGATIDRCTNCQMSSRTFYSIRLYDELSRRWIRKIRYSKS